MQSHITDKKKKIKKTLNSHTQTLLTNAITNTTYLPIGDLIENYIYMGMYSCAFYQCVCL